MLRAIVAILLVLGHHPVVMPQSAGVLKLPATIWWRVGWTGVDLFFVLSGFLIGGLLFKEYQATGVLDVKRFIIRRGLKIWRCYYLLLAANFVARWIVEKKGLHNAVLETIPGFLHVQNFTHTGSHTWSLAVEEHFYLILPFLLHYLCKRTNNRGLRDLPIIAIIVMSMCLLYRCVAGIYVGTDGSWVFFPTQARLDSLFCGVMIAYFYHTRRAVFANIEKHRGIAIVASLCLIAPFTQFVHTEHVWISSVGYCLLYAAYGTIIIALVTLPEHGDKAHPFTTNIVTRIVAWVGTYSYNIYLWHMLVQKFMATLYPHTPISKLHGSIAWAMLLTIYIAVAVTVGATVSRLVEIPTLRLRERVFPARATAI